MKHKILHPLMRTVAKALINFPVKAFKQNPIPKGGPVIFAANHSNVHDLPMSIHINREHFFVLADDGTKGTLAGTAFEANGVIWVRRNDKNSGKEALDSMREHLRKGHKLLIFPEGTWNTHECLPMLPIRWSMTELAREFNCPIVPITLEYPDLHSSFYSIGESFYVHPSWTKAEAAAHLRDVMAEMRWNFWKSRGSGSRADITYADYEIYTIDRFKEYQPVTWAEDFEREKKNIFKPYTTPEQAFAFMDHLIPCRENAFLFRK